MISLYSVVAAKRRLDANIPKGTRGAVVMVLKEGYEFEVEFVDEEGDTIKVVSAKISDLEEWLDESKFSPEGH
jgi:hypothetical protein